MESETIVMTESGELEGRTIEVPEPGSDELLLEVELTGVCGSDVHMREHDLEMPYPVVPGHEFVGTVVELGDDIETDSARRSIREGDALTVVPGISCGDCWYCENMPTRPLTCNDRDVHGFRSVDDEPRLHGAMSEYFLVEGRASFYRLPREMEPELGALVEPLSVATHAIERAFPPGLPHAREGFGMGRSVVVQGAGPIGLLTVAAANVVGAGQIVAVDMIDERLAMAERFGATETVDVRDHDDLAEVIAGLTPSGDGPDVAVEAVGHPEAFEQALRIPHNGGTVVEVGHFFPNGTAEVDPSEIIHGQLDIYGSLAYPPGQFETAISVLERSADRLPYRELFDDGAPLAKVEEAFDRQASGEVYRATVRP